MSFVVVIPARYASTRLPGKPLAEIVPELNELMATARSSAQRLLQGQIEINRDNIERQLSVRVSSEQTGQSNESYIITLDDITELVTAQRTSAWADVARRIAHEIKNPLAGIKGAAQLLARSVDTGAQRMTKLIQDEVDRVASLIDRMEGFTDTRKLERKARSLRFRSEKASRS